MKRLRWLLLVVVCPWWSVDALTAPVEAPVYQMKSALLLKLYDYFAWPGDKAVPDFSLALVGKDPELFAELRRAATRFPVRGRPLRIARPAVIGELAGYHLVYVAADSPWSLEAVAAATRKTGTLLVSDGSLAHKDIMVNILTDAEGIRFEVNRINIVFDGLVMDSEIMLLGGTELELARLFRENEYALQQLKASLVDKELEVDSLQQERQRQNRHLAQLKTEQAMLNRQLTRDRQRLTEQGLLIDRQRTSLSTLQQQLADKQQHLSETEQQLADRKGKLDGQLALLADNEQRIQALTRDILANNQLFGRQQAALASQAAQLGRQQEQLSTLGTKVTEQRALLAAGTVAGVVVLGLLVVILWSYRARRRANAELAGSLDELHRTQDQLVEARKMAALNLLTSGIAHEVNTPLGICITAVSSQHVELQKIRQRLAAGLMTRADLEQFLERCEHGNQVTSNSLAKSASLIERFKDMVVDTSAENTSAFAVGDHLTEILAKFQSTLAHAQIRVAVDCPASLQLRCDHQVFEQVITELVTNSITHGFEGRADGEINIVVRQCDTELEIDYRDDGQGIGQEELAQIFNPFFTSKRGKGHSGLGLSIIYNLVNHALAGTIACEEHPEVGCHFLLRLPLDSVSSLPA